MNYPSRKWHITFVNRTATPLPTIYGRRGSSYGFNNSAYYIGQCPDTTSSTVYRSTVWCAPSAPRSTCRPLFHTGRRHTCDGANTASFAFCIILAPDSRQSVQFVRSPVTNAIHSSTKTMICAYTRRYLCALNITEFKATSDTEIIQRQAIFSAIHGSSQPHTERNVTVQQLHE